ncbi:MAG: hypothetical protein ACOX3F_01735 [Kiritimatiellia bacterium]|jgi:hypothetical protein
MAFERGVVSFRMVELPRPFPEDWAERFAARRAGGLEGVGGGVQRGWVTGRHLLDTMINEDSARYGGWVRLALRLAERKVPAALLQAECRMEELAVQAAEGKPFLRAKERAEIRRGVMERLLPSMPPQLRAIPFVYLPGATWLYVSALPNSAWDVFHAALVSTLGLSGSPATPEVLAAGRHRVSLRDLPNYSFSPEMEGEVSEPAPGQEFLTWLWFKAETQLGQIALSDGRVVSVLVEGPLVFRREGQGAHAVVLKKGAPESSAEAKTCLMGGKKLKEARLTLALDGERVWSFGFEADEFLVRGLKLPQSAGALDGLSRFQERMVFLEEWREMFLDLFGAFVGVRGDGKKWRGVLGEIREWVAGRPGRR